MTTKLLSAFAVLAILAAGTVTASADTTPIRNDKNRIIGYTNAQPTTHMAVEDAVKDWKLDFGSAVKSLFGGSDQSSTPAPAAHRLVNDKNRPL